MGRSVEEILRADVIIREVSRIKLPNTTLSDLFGWGLANRDPAAQGANSIAVDARDGKYDVFNQTRMLASARVPGTASSRQAPQKVGKVNYTIPRAAETIPLTDEDLTNRRVIGGPSNILDSAGENYISRQQRYLAQRFGNMIEFQTAAMCRGSYTYDQEGDDLHQRFTGGEHTINYRIPTGNLTDLDMLGGGNNILGPTWATAGTDIPLALYEINEAFNQLVGRGLEHVITRSAVWNNVLNNTKVAAQGGSANVVFETLDRRGPGNFTARLRAIPWVQWHIMDYTLDIWDGSAFTATNLIADNHAIFMVEPDQDIAQYFDGGEMVTEGPNGVRTFRNGFYAYGYPTHDPSGWNLAAIHNGFPGLYNPSAIAYGDTTSSA